MPASKHVDLDGYFAPHLQGAYNRLAVSLHRMDIPHGQQCAVDIHRQIQQRADAQVFYVQIASMFARRLGGRRFLLWSRADDSHHGTDRQANA